jgi:hypothetical protein
MPVTGLPAEDKELALKPFNLTHNSDMKAAWYLSNRGGGCKTTEVFCTVCSCTRDRLTSYNIGELCCERCKQRGKCKCYHHSVCDSVTVAALLSDLESELGEYYDRCGKQYDEVKKKSKIRTDHMMANKSSDINHIDYCIPPDDDDEKKKAVCAVCFS